MKAQMKYADKRNSPVVIIQGSDEKAKGEAQIKDLAAGARASASIATNEEWKAQRPRISVPESELVDRVREILAGREREPIVNWSIPIWVVGETIDRVRWKRLRISKKDGCNWARGRSRHEQEDSPFSRRR